MGYNSVVSGHPKSTGIPRVDGLSTGPLDLGRHNSNHMQYKLKVETTKLKLHK